MPEERFQVEQLAPERHDRQAFSCGVEELDRYLRQQARQDHRRGLAVPYVLVDTEDGAVAGYYTLSSFAIGLPDLPESERRKLPRYPSVPGILIGRLAADRRYRGQRLGELLLLDALHRSLDASKEIAAMAVVVDAIGDDARSFYEHYEFQRFPDKEYRLFLMISTIQGMFP